MAIIAATLKDREAGSLKQGSSQLRDRSMLEEMEEIVNKEGEFNAEAPPLPDGHIKVERSIERFRQRIVDYGDSKKPAVQLAKEASNCAIDALLLALFEGPHPDESRKHLTAIGSEIDRFATLLKPSASDKEIKKLCGRIQVIKGAVNMSLDGNNVAARIALKSLVSQSRSVI